MGRIRKGFIVMMPLILILLLFLNNSINDFSLKQDSSKLHLSDIPIQFGETITDSIDFVGDIGNYTFSANAGDTVLIRISELSGINFDPEVRLYSPSGIELSSAWSYAVTELSYNLPQNGVYKVSVCDHEEVDTGTYCIYIQRVNNPGSATSIKFGEIMYGSIDLPCEANSYNFSASDGDAVLIKIGKSSGTNFAHEIRLYSPTGTEIARDWDSTTSSEIYYALPQNGIYTILVCDYSSLYSGAYYIFIQRLNNPENATVIDFGNTTPASIGFPGEADTFTFSSNAGDTVLVRISEVSGVNFNPEIRLYSPSGIELTRAWWYDATELSYTLPQNGIYTVLACDHEGIDSGAYCIYIQKVNNPGNTIPIKFGSIKFGSIDQPGDAKSYTFSASTGDIILTRIGKVSGANFAHEIRLYSPTGTELARDWDSTTSSEIYYALPQNGIYTILVCDYSSLYSGTYYIFIQRVNNPNNTAFIEFSKIGIIITASIELPSEADTFTFSSNAGDIVLVRISEVSGVNFNPEIRLYSPSGIELTRAWWYDATELSYTLPQNGIYTVLACDHEGIDNGAYEIFFQWLYKNDTSIINLSVPYIHQCWDTPNDFDGRWACGATSAVMILAYYGIIAPWPCECTMPYTHTSNYGNYVCKEYTYGNYTFNDITLDASYNPAYGAYGYIHYSDGLAKLGRMVDYFEIHGLESWEVYSPSESEIRAELDSGHPVPASTKLTELGHWVVIVGYTEDGYYIVHDPFGSKPYGSNPGGNYNGSYVLYTWEEMKINEKWIAVVHPKEEANLILEIVDQFFSTEKFDIKFLIFDDNGIKISSANIQMWWNETDVSTSVQNLGNGLYFVSLEPITVAPGEDPILLKIIVSADGYPNKYFETTIAVDPESLNKPDGAKPSTQLIPGYNLYFLIIVMCLISIYFYSKRKKS